MSDPRPQSAESNLPAQLAIDDGPNPHGPPNPIRGYPELHWAGKRPGIPDVLWVPAEERERYGEPTLMPDGSQWINRLYWGDNLQVMAHLLKEFHEKVQLIYIDPPFDSKADYKKSVVLRGARARNDHTPFEEKQYADMWSGDDYLQFMYERLQVLRQLLAPTGSIYLHCDWHQAHHLRCLLDEVFGPANFKNEIIWQRTDPHNDSASRFGWVHDTILWYAKSADRVTFNADDIKVPLSAAALKEYSLLRLPNGDTIPYSPEVASSGRRFKLDDCTYKGTDPKRQFLWRGAMPSPKRVWPYASADEMDAALARGEFYLRDATSGAARCRVSFLDNRDGQMVQSIWTDVGRMKGGFDYPTQKPKKLLERIIRACSHRGDLVFDAFMGSGTSMVVAMEQGRRFLGCDINRGAIETAIQCLVDVAGDLNSELSQVTIEDDGAREAPSTGFTVNAVAEYDFFRNADQARDTLRQLLELEPLEGGDSVIYDGRLDMAIKGRRSERWLVKILNVQGVSTRADLKDLLTPPNLNDLLDRQRQMGSRPCAHLLLVTLGHEPELETALANEWRKLGLIVDVVATDIVRERKDIVLRRPSEARVTLHRHRLCVEGFYPFHLLHKLSLNEAEVVDWRETVAAITIDYDYDGEILNGRIVDVPAKKSQLVNGEYELPEGHGAVAVKITDVLDDVLIVGPAEIVTVSDARGV